jgi:hypothetical protein
MNDRARTDERLFEFRVKQERPATGRACDHPGCAKTAEFRAPKSRTSLAEYHWFCLDHVRAYNQSWDYFAGMSEPEISAWQRDAITGHRPTWIMGRRSAPRPEDAAAMGAAWTNGVDDVFTILDDGPGGPQRRYEEPKPKRRFSKLQLDALAVLGLDEGATLPDLKARYKELVKRYHPDTNGGDRGAEERLKQVIKAYGTLKSSGFR